MSETNNPLLSKNELPLFTQLKPEQIEPAIDSILSENRKTIEKLLSENKEYTWNNLVYPIEIIQANLNDVWAIVSHLESVKNTPEWHKAYEITLPKISEYYTELAQNEKLYQAFLKVRQGAGFKKLNFAEQKIIDNNIRDFKLAGVALPPEKRAEVKALSMQLSELESQFQQNVLQATQGWSLHITDVDKLKGLPDRALEASRLQAKEQEKEGWALTLDYPSYHAVLTYADDRGIRETVYQAFTTRASNLFPGKEKFDNSQTMVKIMKLRQRLASLLDFNHYAEYALANRMLKSPEQVLHFLNDLSDRCQDVAGKEANNLKTFAKEQCQIADLRPWDVAYVSEKMLHANYAISQETLRQYFPEDSVLNGLFTIVNRLYGISINEVKQFDKWHESVRLFEIYDANNHLRGKFYLDPYARPDKRGGAWVVPAKVRVKQLDGNIQAPVTYVVTNFSKPLAGGPALLTHDEVTTLFHEFGHCLHATLSKVDYPSIAGINGVYWDAVELPSQLMENWCWEEEALKLFAKHHETNEPLPHDLFLKLKASKNFQVSLGLIRQLEFALFDFNLHMHPAEENDAYIQTVLDKVREQTAFLPLADFNRSQNSFLHIFSGGYSAGYYSYLWSEVMSADAFQAFKSQNKVFDNEIAARFLYNILEQGGSKDFMDLFVAFRGREPEVNALLKQYELVQ